jgi:four helix bundle protein
MNEKAEKLRNRTAAFAKAVIELCEKVRETSASRVITKQLIEAATSVAANYRAVCRARSKRDFVAKMAIVLEESDECHGWLEMLVDNSLLQREAATAAIQEAHELTAIFTASLLTARRRLSATRTSTNQST